MRKKCVRFLSALLTASLLLSVSACKKKDSKTEEIERRAEGVVEDYLAYLTKDKPKKLSRYCNRADDPFQQTEQYFTDEPHSATFTNYLSSLKFKIGDASVEGDTVDVPVKIRYIDALKALEGQTDSMTLQDINEIFSDTKPNAEKEIVFHLALNSSDDTCRIQSTKELHDELYGQYLTFLSKLPDISELVNQKLDFFMGKVRDMDMSFFDREGCDFGELDLYDYRLELMPLFKTTMTFMTYEIEIEQTTDTTASGLIHVVTKDDKTAGNNLFGDPQKMAPFMEQYILVLLRGLPDGTTIIDTMNYATVAKTFQKELEKVESYEHDIHFDLKLDENAKDGFTIKADIGAIMPSKDPFLNWNYNLSDLNLESYLLAAKQLHEQKVISDTEYARVNRTFGNTPFDVDAFDASAIAHGYTLEKDTAFFRQYKKGDHTTLTIYMESNRDLAVDYAFGRMINFNELAIDGAYSGTLNGGSLYFETCGQRITLDEPVELMTWNAVAQTHVIYIEIENGTDEEKQEIRDFLKENGLT